ncbi:MAG: ParB N-terminal domain-containing protein, partial [Nostoc sp.]
MNSGSTSQRTPTKTRKPRAKKEDSQDVVPDTTLLVDKKEDSNFAAITKVLIDEIIIPTTQPRRYFASKAMQSLVESVKRDGILVPLLVR